MKYLGIDIGTTSICGALADTDKKYVSDILTLPNNAAEHTKHTWESIQSPEKILAEATSLYKHFIKKHKHIDGIGITGQMHGILYLDKNGNPLSSLYTWQDQRGSNLYAKNLTYAGYLSSQTGYAVYSGYGMATHLYNLKNKLVPKNATVFCTIHDYIAMKFAHCAKPITDATDAASFGLFDLKKKCFDKDAIVRCSINPDLIPQVKSSYTLVGETEQNVPVYSAIGDNQASFIGSVKDIKDSVLINIGTGSQVSKYADHYVCVENLETRPFTGKGYILVGAAISGGSSYALLEKFFFGTCSFFDNKPTEKLYAIMNSIDINRLNGNELTVHTQFKGTRQNSNFRGCIDNIGIENFTPQHLIAGFLNGMVNELYYFYKFIPVNVRKNVKHIIGSGNAVRKNLLLQKIIEKQFGYKLTLPRYTEEAAVGAALYAAVGNGYYKNIEESCQKFHTKTK